MGGGGSKLHSDTVAASLLPGSWRMSPLRSVKDGQEGGEGRLRRPMAVGLVRIRDPEIGTTSPDLHRLGNGSRAAARGALLKPNPTHRCRAAAAHLSCFLSTPSHDSTTCSPPECARQVSFWGIPCSASVPTRPSPLLEYAKTISKLSPAV